MTSYVLLMLRERASRTSFSNPRLRCRELLPLTVHPFTEPKHEHVYRHFRMNSAFWPDWQSRAPIPRACMSFRRDSGILILTEQQIILPEARCDAGRSRKSGYRTAKESYPENHVMTGAYEFICPYGSTHDLHARLNQLGEWQWQVGDSHWYGDYVACVPFAGVRIRICYFPAKVGNEYKYQADVKRSPDF